MPPQLPPIHQFPSPAAPTGGAVPGSGASAPSVGLGIASRRTRAAATELRTESFKSRVRFITVPCMCNMAVVASGSEFCAVVRLVVAVCKSRFNSEIRAFAADVSVVRPETSFFCLKRSTYNTLTFASAAVVRVMASVVA